MNLGFSEMAFILVAALLLVGPKKLPEIGRQVGRAMAEFKRATGQLQAQINQVTQSVEMAADIPRFNRQTAWRVLSNVGETQATPAAPAAAAAQEETHV